VGPLRARFLGHFAPLVRDVVIAGHDRDFLAALIFSDFDACAVLCVDGAAGAGAAVILRNDAVRAEFQSRLASFAAESTGSSNRIVRAILCEEPPSLDAGEITDKGSFNQRNVLDRRAALVEQMYLADPPLHVLRI
jgi:feruloyl-CoA synthase